MTLIVPPALVPTVLGKAASVSPLQSQVLAGALSQAAQQRQRSTAAITETPKAVARIARPERARDAEKRRLPDDPPRRGDLLDLSA